jgi:hypothetical protein
MSEPDLDVPGHSVARVLAARGHVVAVAVDHLGVPDSGHHHVVSPNRALLFDRLLRWADSVLPQEVP